jgi:hypothetical protein
MVIKMYTVATTAVQKSLLERGILRGGLDTVGIIVRNELIRSSLDLAVAGPAVARRFTEWAESLVI